MVGIEPWLCYQSMTVGRRDGLVNLIITHGAGSNRNAPLLVALERELIGKDVTVIRYDLPFRQARSSGPPRPSEAALDRAGLREQAVLARARGGVVWLGGLSYGGRQASMLAAESPDVADGLLLLSYPLHPPGKPAQQRTAHLPQIRIPVLMIQGTKDPFGSPEEMSAALTLLGGRRRLAMIPGAGHDLGRDRVAAARTIAGEFLEFIY